MSKAGTQDLPVEEPGKRFEVKFSVVFLERFSILEEYQCTVSTDTRIAENIIITDFTSYIGINRFWQSGTITLSPFNAVVAKFY